MFSTTRKIKITHEEGSSTEKVFLLFDHPYYSGFYNFSNIQGSDIGMDK